MSSQLLFFFSLLGAFNGLLLAIWLFTRKPATLANRFLAMLIFMISVRIGKSVFLFFSTELDYIYRQIGLSACFLIGPALYFYFRAHRDASKSKQHAWQWHLVTLSGIVVLAAIYFPFQENTPDINGLMYRGINYIWLGYLLLSLPMAIPAIKARFKQSLKTPLDAETNIQATAWLGTFAVWLAYFTSSYTSYIVGALSFSFLLYLTVLLLLYERSKKQETRYQNKRIDEQQARALIEKLKHQMESEKRFTDANLTLPQLAKLTGVNVPQLSQLLNDNLNSSFNQFVNRYRIEEAKRLLGETPQLSLELIAERSGFNSQSTFYNAFKRLENTTPARYRQQFT
ncbi:helix-turn-helix domain-containing protein [Planctobacterium marinum]